MSGLLQASATSRAVRWEALSVLGSAPRSNRICAVLRFPPAALNIKGVMPDNIQEGYIATFILYSTVLILYRMPLLGMDRFS